MQATLATLLDQAVVSSKMLNELHQSLNELDRYIAILNAISNVRKSIDYLLLVSIYAGDKLSLLRIGSISAIIDYVNLVTLVYEVEVFFKRAFRFTFHFEIKNLLINFSQIIKLGRWTRRRPLRSCQGLI